MGFLVHYELRVWPQFWVHWDLEAHILQNNRENGVSLPNEGYNWCHHLYSEFGVMRVLHGDRSMTGLHLPDAFFSRTACCTRYAPCPKCSLLCLLQHLVHLSLNFHGSQAIGQEPPWFPSRWWEEIKEYEVAKVKHINSPLLCSNLLLGLL